MTKKNKIEDIYVKLSQEEHILKRPDTYVGTIEPQTESIWAFNNDKIEKQELTYIPAFIKLFDEILTNASDHAHRPGTKVKNIKINIDDNWNISVWNDGEGIPIQKHKEHNIYVPELIFGHLLTGSNYNDNEDRYGAGRNGLGAKLVGVFSSKFVIDCADGKKSYYQEILNNTTNKKEPIIKTCKKSYTSITYTTDFERLPIKGIEEDTLKIIKKRIYDVAVYNPKVKIYFNDELIDIKNIRDWIELHTDEEIYYEDVNDKWAVGISKSDGFEQCSIVNGNTTWQGGTHVNFIMNNIVNTLTTKLTKGKKHLKIRSTDIKNRIHLFLVCKIPNPAFDTQTKVNLKTRVKDKFDLSVKFYKDVMNSEIVESILEWIELKEQQRLKKVNKKSAGKTLRIPKLVDAHKAGTVNGYKATLCISEGDSALGSVLAGFSEVNRDYWGAFPVKGRPLNVRDVPASKIANNEEISNIIKILGLVPGKKYKDLKELRYGKVAFFTDADPHGISIKGLLINLFHKMWPELLELGFCYEFITPIVKATKGKKSIEYYDIDKYKREKDTKLQGYKIKYYKGLGTFMAKDMKTMFKDINKHLIQFKYDPKTDNDKIDLLFNKKKADLRKEWMLNYKGEIIPDKFGKPNPISEFFDNEFIQFSNYDNVISIPDVMDGLKISQRKILYSALKKNITKETKVAQFGASTSELTHYNHGENNMFGTIVNMAQDFVGSNNINLFEPAGNFGSRKDPKASASPRYIFTHLTDVTRLIYRKEDDEILNYLDEDGEQIEPDFYLPIIPMILVNGTAGIGTGWSTDIPMYDPQALIQVIKRKLVKPTQKYMINPSYKNWNGEIEYIAEKNTYKTYGVYTVKNKSKKIIQITELPIGVTTDKYISTLDKLIDDKKIKKVIDNSTDQTIDITITLDNVGDIYKDLKLTNNVSINNMHTWFNGEITKWETAEELLNTWIDERLKYYSVRKKQWAEHLDIQFNRYANLFKFIDDVINEEIVVNNKKINDILAKMETMYDKYNDSYDYLLNLPAYAFTQEKYEYYKNQAKSMKKELKRYKSLKPEDIWNEELEQLETYLDKNY